MSEDYAYRDWWDGLTEDEQDEFRAYGRSVARSSNPNDIDDLATAFLTHGMTDDAIRVLGLKDNGVAFMREAIEDITGWRLEYNDAVQQWYSVETGRFMGKLRLEEGMSYNMTNDEFSQWIINKFGMYTE